ncbi:MAG: hypothetical protein AAF490_15940 [Chloroflexota bacterium]
MRNQYSNKSFSNRVGASQWPISKQTTIGFILITSLLAFEIFNFDTTQYALRNLIGDVRFAGIQWASILAIAFCSIDFAGLIRLFTPEQGSEEPKVVWYLMGAWLLGATMNAVMTWWAISLTLLNHNFGNEVLTREQLLLYVPIFVATLVWLTRILFIGAFTVAGERIFDRSNQQEAKSNSKKQSNSYSKSRQTGSRASNNSYSNTRRQPAVSRIASPRKTTTQTMMRAAPKPQAQADPEYFDDMETQYFDQSEPVVRRETSAPVRQPASSRVRQRPPRPNGPFPRPSAMSAKGKNSTGNGRH